MVVILSGKKYSLLYDWTRDGPAAPRLRVQLAAYTNR